MNALAAASAVTIHVGAVNTDKSIMELEFMPYKFVSSTTTTTTVTVAMHMLALLGSASNPQ